MKLQQHKRLMEKLDKFEELKMEDMSDEELATAIKQAQDEVEQARTNH